MKMWLDFSPVRDSLWVGVSLLECPRQLLVSTLRLLGDKGIMLSDSRQFSAKTMHTHKNTHTQKWAHTHSSYSHNVMSAIIYISCIYYHSIKAHSHFIHHDQQPGTWPTYVLSCWMDVWMRWISSASRRFRARCATASVCRAFRQRGIRSSIDW